MADCHQLLASRSSPFPGELPFACSGCLPWPAARDTLQTNCGSDTFSATPVQGCTVSIFASGENRAFFAFWRSAGVLTKST